MKNTFLLFVFLACAFAAASQTTPPATEIYLFDISSKKDKVSISNPVNFTQHPGGYDNQPYFHPQLDVVYFTASNAEGRTDLKSYDYDQKKTKSITETSEKEYSPTVTPDRQYLSCIIQRDNGAQDLGKYPIEGGEPSLIVNHMTVGYHVWTDNSHLGLFILGKDGAPATLHYLLLPMKRDTILASNIGRSLHRVPGETAFSFVHKVTDKDWYIKKFNNHTKKIADVAAALPGREDLCWLPDGKILMSDGTGIFFYQPGKSTSWKPVEIEGASVLKGVTRLAASPDGKKIAIVVSE
ncbi:MAG TPA: hypothetical protein VG737_13815 [Cyclobacteriaceae bacterium]|nr:hypothetical protein [Cyclobacteriaceae bacterium]